MSQIVLAWATLRRRVRGGRPDAHAALRNDVVAWRLGVAVEPSAMRPTAPRRVSARIVALVAVVEAALAFGAIHSLRTHATHAAHGEQHVGVEP